jgi:starch phosphorylase
MSVLDGWWDEAYDSAIGWAIGHGEMYDDYPQQDRIEANAVYKLLEDDAVPLFYKRGQDKLPRGWIERMKTAMRALCPVFNANRMVHEYASRLYLPAADRSTVFLADDLAQARALADWKAKLIRAWPQLKLLKTEVSAPPQPVVGSVVRLQAIVQTGELTHDDIAVEVYAGQLDPRGEIADGAPSPMEWQRSNPDGSHVFAGDVRLSSSGLYGTTIRVRPSHKDVPGPFEMRMVLWAG